MEDRIVITDLPLPSRSLSPNARVHWAVKARTVKWYRQAAHIAATMALGRRKPRWRRATVQVTFRFRTRHRRDPDNLLASLKPAFDGLVDAGLLLDDAGLTHLPVVLTYDKNRPGVEMAVERD